MNRRGFVAFLFGLIGAGGISPTSPLRVQAGSIRLTKIQDGVITHAAAAINATLGGLRKHGVIA